MKNKSFNPNCPHCDGTGKIEIDPSNPEEADTPQYITCDCCLEYDDEGMEYDEYEDRELFNQ
jgi:hypothetical protein